MPRNRDSAKVVEDSGRAVALRTDGPCFTNTLAALEHGAGGSKPMPRAAIEKTRVQVEALLEEVLRTYERDVVAGEVGADGSGRASKAAPTRKGCPTGLLYGRIQSGKTVAMITSAALAIDNGFRVVVVLTSDNVKLVEQTASRFAALDSIVKSSTQNRSWEADANHIRKSLPHHSLVIVCAKNQSHLASLVDFLEQVEAENYPALIMDDEADQATPDTTIAARSSGRANASKLPSKINRMTVHNDNADREGPSVREVLRHHLFLQVTATPYALLLQNSDNPLRPSFTKLLEPGDGYTGGESFFSGDHLDNQAPPLVFVSEEESEELERGTDAPPPGLVQAIAFFLVAAGAQAVLDPSVRARGQNFLCHTSQKRQEHDRVSNLIRVWLERVGDELLKAKVGGVVGIELGKAHAQLLRTVPTAPPLPEILKDLKNRLARRQVVVVNSDADDAEFGHGMNFIVGGNILGRGLTIDNLLVTYYLRRAKVSQMDTMLQHARMFGYRGALMPFTRVFLPERLALRFHRIHVAEQSLRQLLSDPNRRARIPVQVSEGLRATRAGVLDTRSILAYTPGQHLYPAAPATGPGSSKDHERVRNAIVDLGGKFVEQKSRVDPVEIMFADMERLIGLLPFDTADEDTWDPKAIVGVLRSNDKRFGSRGFLYCRRMARTKFREGALSGDELRRLRSLGRPVLCVFLDVGRKYEPSGKRYDHDFTYPSFVLPDVDDMPAHVFNTSE